MDDRNLILAVANLLVRQFGLNPHCLVVDRLACIATCFRPGLVSIGTGTTSHPAAGSDADVLARLPALFNLRPEVAYRLRLIASNCTPGWVSL